MGKLCSFVPALVLAALLAVGCASQPPSPQGSTPATGTADSGTQAAGAGFKAMPAETAAEKNALVLAAKPVGRRWAAGDPNKSAEAAGDPFLAGYSVTLFDGKTQYDVWVLGGVVVPFTNGAGPLYLKFPADGYNTPSPPATGNQRAAVDAAKASLKDVAPNAKGGGIGQYIVFFPRTGTGAGEGYPCVAIFTKSISDSPYAQGGLQYR